MPQIESTVNRKPKSAPQYQRRKFSFGVAHPDDPFFRLLSRFQKVNKLKFGKAKKRALYGQKRWMTWQYALFGTLHVPYLINEEGMYFWCVSERSKKHLQLDLKYSPFETHILVIPVYPFCIGHVITIAPKPLKFQPEESKFCQHLNRIDCTKNTCNEAVPWMHLDQEVLEALHQYHLLPQTEA